jgi:hypothetical protein
VAPKVSDQFIVDFLTTQLARLAEAIPTQPPVHATIAEYTIDVSDTPIRTVPDKFFGVNMAYDIIEAQDSVKLRAAAKDVLFESVRYPGGSISDEFRYDDDVTFDLEAFRGFLSSIRRTGGKRLQPIYVVSPTTHTTTDAAAWAASVSQDEETVWEIGNELFARPDHSLYNYPLSGDWVSVGGSNDGLYFGNPSEYIDGITRTFTDQSAWRNNLDGVYVTQRADYEQFFTRFKQVETGTLTIKVKTGASVDDTWALVAGDGSVASWAALSGTYNSTSLIYMVDEESGGIFFGNGVGGSGIGSKLPATSTVLATYTVERSGFAAYRTAIQAANPAAKVLACWGGAFVPTYYAQVLEFFPLAESASLVYDGLVMHYYPFSGTSGEVAADQIKAAAYRGLTTDRQIMEQIDRLTTPDVPKVYITEYNMTMQMSSQNTTFAGVIGIASFLYTILPNVNVECAMVHMLIDSVATVDRNEVINGETGNYEHLPKAITLAAFAAAFANAQILPVEIVQHPVFSPSTALRTEIYPLSEARRAELSAELQADVQFLGPSETLPEVFAIAALSRNSNAIQIAVVNTSSAERTLRFNITGGNYTSARKNVMYKDGSGITTLNSTISLTPEKQLQDTLHPYSVNFYDVSNNLPVSTTSVAFNF